MPPEVFKRNCLKYGAAVPFPAPTKVPGTPVAVNTMPTVFAEAPMVVNTVGVGVPILTII